MRTIPSNDFRVAAFKIAAREDIATPGGRIAARMLDDAADGLKTVAELRMIARREWIRGNWDFRVAYFALCDLARHPEA